MPVSAHSCCRALFGACAEPPGIAQSVLPCVVTPRVCRALTLRVTGWSLVACLIVLQYLEEGLLVLLLQLGDDGGSAK